MKQSIFKSFFFPSKNNYEKVFKAKLKTICMPTAAETKNNMKIPKFVELIKYETLDEKLIINEVNWQKLIELQKISSNSSSETGNKADRFLGYYICYLVQKNILEDLEKNRDTYVIQVKARGKSASDIPLNPEKDGIIYGFVRKKDAIEYSRIVCNEINSDFVIERYEDLCPEDD